MLQKLYLVKFILFYRVWLSFGRGKKLPAGEAWQLFYVCIFDLNGNVVKTNSI